MVNLVNISEIVSFGSMRNNSYSVSKVFMRVSFTSLVLSYVRHKRSIYVSSCFSIKKVLLVDGLKHNLLSVSQLCDKGFIVCFHNNKCTLTLKNDISLEGFRVDNIYKINLDRVDTKTEICLKTTLDESWLWHRRLCHASMHTLRKRSHISLPVLHVDTRM